MVKKTSLGQCRDRPRDARDRGIARGTYSQAGRSLFPLGNDSTWFYEGIFDSTDLVGNVRFVNKKVASFKRPDSLRANSRVYELKEGLDYVVNVTVGAVGIVNYSNHLINEVKFEWASTSCAETTFERSWGEEPNVLAGREIPPGKQYSWPPPPSYGCVLSRVRSLKR